MDYFGRERLKELLEPAAGAAVSIYLPTHRSSSEAEVDRLRFRAALDQARELLSEDGSDDETLARLEELDPLTREQEFWRYQADGLAVFLGPGFARMYRVPTELPELVVVGPTFHTRPLLELLQAPDRYWVLGLSQKNLRLWEGTAAGATPLDLRNLPRDMLDALGFEYERDANIVQRQKLRRQRSQPGRGGHAPVFHGHGAAKNEVTEAELRKFFRKVDRGLADLLEGETGPVVLATVKEYHPLYRSASGLGNLVEEGIEANVTEWTPERIHEAAWPIVESVAMRQVDRALQLWENAYGAGKGEADVANLCHQAVAGRLRLLLTERGRRVWGTLDRDTGEVEILQEGGEDPGEHAAELLNELAEVVILRGGDALSLSEEHMPTDTGAAGILR